MEEIWYTPEERLPELGDKVIYVDKITKETKLRKDKKILNFVKSNIYYQFKKINFICIF